LGKFAVMLVPTGAHRVAVAVYVAVAVGVGVHVLGILAVAAAGTHGVLVQVAVDVLVELAVTVGVQVGELAAAPNGTHGVSVTVGVVSSGVGEGVAVSVWSPGSVGVAVGWVGVLLGCTVGGGTLGSFEHRSGSSFGGAPQMEAQVLSTSKIDWDGKNSWLSIGSPASGWSNLSW
jgi:hypothetical protein